ncbi:hypothetical protein SR39_25795 [Methylobacterium radiotolerans]|nr:hypothetical protein SR39_25795 [Methylobacterium radiotolerans]
MIRRRRSDASAIAASAIRMAPTWWTVMSATNCASKALPGIPRSASIRPGSSMPGIDASSAGAQICDAAPNQLRHH